MSPGGFGLHGALKGACSCHLSYGKGRKGNSALNNGFCPFVLCIQRLSLTLWNARNAAICRIAAYYEARFRTLAAPFEVMNDSISHVL